jgi:hypothetical protein
MRLSELLGAEVVDEHGRAVGKVHDVRLEQSGPALEGFGPSLRLEGLIVGRRALGVRFGFGRGGVRGPWLLKPADPHRRHGGRPPHAMIAGLALLRCRRRREVRLPPRGQRDDAGQGADQHQPAGQGRGGKP